MSLQKVYVSSSTVRLKYFLPSTFRQVIEIHNQKRYRLAASCGFYRPAPSCEQVAASLWKSDLLQLDICRLAVSYWKHLLASSLWIKSLDNQLAASLLTTCSRLVIVKPEQAMRTYPDIGFMTARQQSCHRLVQLACFWLCGNKCINTKKEQE